jgi:hypothetical protein
MNKESSIVAEFDVEAQKTRNTYLCITPDSAVKHVDYERLHGWLNPSGQTGKAVFIL